MKIDRALQIKREAAISIYATYASARISKPNGARLGQEIANIMQHMPKGTPYWVKAYCEGYAAALSKELYRDSITYGGYVDGVFYSTDSKRADYYQKHGIAPAEYAEEGRVQERGLYWAEPSNGAMRPYFIN